MSEQRQIFRLGEVEEMISEMDLTDVAVTVVYEADADRTGYIYFESDGMVTTLYNWLNGRMSASQIEELECELIAPNED